MRDHQRRWRFLGRYCATKLFTVALDAVAVFSRHERYITTFLLATHADAQLHSHVLSQLFKRSRIDPSAQSHVLLDGALFARFILVRDYLFGIRSAWKKTRKKSTFGTLLGFGINHKERGWEWKIEGYLLLWEYRTPWKLPHTLLGRHATCNTSWYHGCKVWPKEHFSGK